MFILVVVNIVTFVLLVTYVIGNKLSSLLKCRVKSTPVFEFFPIPDLGGLNIDKILWMGKVSNSSPIALILALLFFFRHFMERFFQHSAYKNRYVGNNWLHFSHRRLSSPSGFYLIGINTTKQWRGIQWKNDVMLSKTFHLYQQIWRQIPKVT